MIKLSSLKTKPGNPRKISDNALDKLAESIQRDPEFMRLRPMVVDSDGVVMGGNQRLKACKRLGMTEVPDDWVKQADGLTDEQMRRFVLVDNAPQGMAGDWDADLLLDEWELPELEDLGFDMDAFDIEPTNDQKEPVEVDYSTIFEVAVTCEDETDQKAVYKIMTGKGYKCRVLSM